MTAEFGIVITWVVVVIGIVAMKKIEPHNRWYPIYAILIGILVTNSLCS